MRRFCNAQYAHPSDISLGMPCAAAVLHDQLEDYILVMNVWLIN